MDESTFKKAQDIIFQQNNAKRKIESINNVLQICPEKEGKNAEMVLLKEAYFKLQEHYQVKLISTARLLLEKNKQELSELITYLKNEFDNL